MKKVLISVFVLVFLLGISFAFADDKCPAAKCSPGCCAKGKTQAAASMSQKSETKVEDPHAACAAKHGEQATAVAAPGETKIEAPAAIEAPVAVEAPATPEAPAAETKPEGEMKVPEKGCPEVTEKSALFIFHETMHPMHVALEEDNYAEIRTLYPKMQETVKGVADYKCPNWNKCSPECKADFENKKAGLLKSIDELGGACKGEDNAKIDATFEVMHEAYIQFASKCAHGEPSKAKEAQVEETKAEETK